MSATYTTSFTLAGVIPVFPFEAKRIDVQLIASTTFAQGLVMGELDSSHGGPGVYKAYASGNTDGSQIPKGILEFASATDSNSLATLGSASSTGQYQQQFASVPMFVAGTFNTADLTGLDANAITVLGGRLISGVLANGVFRMP